jgi:hypothetical protein
MNLPTSCCNRKGKLKKSTGRAEKKMEEITSKWTEPILGVCYSFLPEI